MQGSVFKHQLKKTDQDPNTVKNAWGSMKHQLKIWQKLVQEVVDECLEGIWEIKLLISTPSDFPTGYNSESYAHVNAARFSTETVPLHSIQINWSILYLFD